MADLFRFADELGPVKIIHVYEPSIQLKAILVVDNVAAGPSIGGVRMAPDVGVEECLRLARAMTLKNAAAGLAHGGGKAVVFGDPKMAKPKKEALIRGLAKALRNEEDYIFGPDMGTDEHCMAWVHDEIGRAVGLPRELGGIPLDDVGATGWGVAQVADVALEFCDVNRKKGVRVVVQGFGAVGHHAARFLADKGAVLVAASDSAGAIHDPDGLDVNELITLKEQGKSVSAAAKGKSIDRDAVIDMDCDIWIPAARPDVVNEDNVHRLRAKLVIEGANIPITLGAEKVLAEKGILCVPDFIANAGGVICAAMEYHGTGESTVFQVIEDKLRRNTRLVLEASASQRILPRQAAMDLAVQRVKKAMSMRRFSLFSSAPGFA
ncbi:MAG TPA: Glu/Leu/Phe/Val dehydrogenase [Nitrospiria bacterium]|nr:Glu/Leu/Phe/Val dehydrogenase [Nitrospiria bacterium]